MKYPLSSLFVAGATILISHPLAQSQTADLNAEPLKHPLRKANSKAVGLQDKGTNPNSDTEKLVDTNGEHRPNSVALEEGDPNVNPNVAPPDETEGLVKPEVTELEDSSSSVNPGTNGLRERNHRESRDHRPLRDTDPRLNEEAAKVRDSGLKEIPGTEEPQGTDIVEKTEEKKADDTVSERLRETHNNGMKRKRGSQSELSEDKDRREFRRKEKSLRKQTPSGNKVVPEPTELPNGVKKEVVEKAESGVKEATAMVERQLEDQKLEIKNEKQAQEMIKEVLGAEGRLSRAEQTRDDRMGIRRNFQNRSGEGKRKREDAVKFLSQRLMGDAELRDAPKFFRTPQPSVQDLSRDPQLSQMILREPRYYHEGRRYLPYSSRAEIPAILLASAALDRIRIQPMREVTPVLRGIPHYGTSLPPEYRRADSQVVSYPVNADTMISSNDILFRQGSTAFADEHSYEMLAALEQTMKRPELRKETFVIEGHASAEGAFDNNLILSQHRAEAIVRDLVRSGIDPSRLIPVGYGEAESESPSDAPENLRRLDRRVVVVRLDRGSVAGR